MFTVGEWLIVSRYAITPSSLLSKPRFNLGWPFPALLLVVVREKLVGGIGGPFRMFLKGLAQPGHLSAPPLFLSGCSG